MKVFSSLDPFIHCVLDRFETPISKSVGVADWARMSLIGAFEIT